MSDVLMLLGALAFAGWLACLLYIARATSDRHRPGYLRLPLGPRGLALLRWWAVFGVAAIGSCAALFGVAAAGRDALPWPVALVAALGIGAATTLAVYALVKRQGAAETGEGAANGARRMIRRFGRKTGDERPGL